MKSVILCNDWFGVIASLSNWYFSFHHYLLSNDFILSFTLPTLYSSQQYNTKYNITLYIMKQPSKQRINKGYFIPDQTRDSKRYIPTLWKEIFENPIINYKKKRITSLWKQKSTNLCSKLLPWSLSTGWFTSCLLSTSHFFTIWKRKKRLSKWKNIWKIALQTRKKRRRRYQ